MAIRKQIALGASIALWLVSVELLPQAVACATPAPSGSSPVSGRERIIERPLLFEESLGQAFEGAGYFARSGRFLTFLTPEKIIWILQERSGAKRDTGERTAWAGHRIQMECLGTSSEIRLAAEEPVPARTVYLRGRHSSDARTVTAANYRRVRYSHVYPGIDLVFHGDRRVLEFDFELSPGADPTQIRMRFDGAESVSIGPDGDLLLVSNAGLLRHGAPRIFQRIDGRQIAVAGHYRLEPDHTVAIEVDSGFDGTRDLIIDPVLGFSGYIGGSAGDVPGAVAVDTEGNIYLAGSTNSIDFPVRNPLQEEFAGGDTANSDAFVMKLDPTGSSIIYSTYIGGAGTDIARSIAVDSLGQALITGTTFSEDFPSTAGSFQTDCSGQCPFVVKLSADGSEFAYSTFIGRGDGSAVAVDSAGQAVITGKTNSSEFPSKNPFQQDRAGGADAFVSKLTADGSDLVFSTFFGGSDDENLTGRQDIAVDGSDNIYVVGKTLSIDFPTLHPVQSQLMGGEDAFVAKFSSQGTLIHSTYLGGSQNDRGQGIAADDAGNAYVTGVTLSDDFPTAHAFQENYAGGLPIGDAFVAKIGPAGGSLVFSTYLGGTAGDTGGDIAVDSLGRAVIAGNASADFPVRDPFRNFDGIKDFVAKFSPDGSELVYSTPIGGADPDVAVATFGTTVYTVGNISTGTLPILDALQPRFQGGTDGFLTEVSDAGTLHFAHFGNGVAEGTQIISEILLTNSSEASPSHAGLSILGDEGAPLPLNLTVTGDPGTAGEHSQTSELDVTVAPLGAVRISTDGQGNVFTGSVTVTFDNPLGGVIRFNLNPAGTAGVGTSQLVRGFITPVRRSAINTGVAISNPGDASIGVTMRLRGTNGEQVQGGLHTLSLGPGEHLAKFIDELFQNAELEHFEGTLTVTTASLNGLLIATALELGPQAGQFTTLPVTPIP